MGLRAACLWGGWLDWVGSRPHPDLRDHGRRPSLRVTTGTAGSRLSGLKAYRTVGGGGGWPHLDPRVWRLVKRRRPPPPGMRPSPRPEALCGRGFTGEGVQVLNKYGTSIAQGIAQAQAQAQALHRHSTGHGFGIPIQRKTSPSF